MVMRGKQMHKRFYFVFSKHNLILNKKNKKTWRIRTWEQNYKLKLNYVYFLVNFMNQNIKSLKALTPYKFFLLLMN